MRYLLFLTISFLSLNIYGQLKPVELSWSVLKDVTYEDKWFEEDQAFYLYPTFGPTIKSYENQLVMISGYFIPVDQDSGWYVLSANPFAACFFCGQAGPESVVSLRASKIDVKDLKLDDFVRFRGYLQLNSDDIMEMNYILKNAKLEE